MNTESGKQLPQRQSFILTLWAENDPLLAQRPVWRCSLENPYTAERQGFKNVADLLRYLERWTAVLPDVTSEADVTPETSDKE